ncbi:hypothetical protein Lal_00029008 [Lupinus albus]|nr:hypothetical protein Lal_00029008 [Lupinus albus]
MCNCCRKIIKGACFPIKLLFLVNYLVVSSLNMEECNRTSVYHYHIWFSFVEYNLVRKSMQIPKDFLVQMLGEERVTKFVIQEILNSTMADYAEKENLDVKDRKISTTQTAQQLKTSFKPGNEFGFNVIIEPQNSQDST